jgi:hypothetical protein
MNELKFSRFIFCAFLGLIMSVYSSCVEEKAVLKMGDSYQGGLIAYILEPGDNGYVIGETHGLIVAPANQSDGIQWYNGTYVITEATDSALFAGANNTDRIVQKQGSGNYAAKICSDLILNGYDDWYLPSIVELSLVRGNLNQLGFDLAKGDVFWSSTEETDMYAATLWFKAALPSDLYPKYSQRAVRAVRRF